MGRAYIASQSGKADAAGQNRYHSWISGYGSKVYLKSMQEAKLHIHRLANSITEEEKQRLRLIFMQATELEVAFWDDALRNKGVSSTNVF